MISRNAARLPADVDAFRTRSRSGTAVRLVAQHALPLLAALLAVQPFQRDGAALARFVARLKPASIVGLLATVVLLFGFQAETIWAQPLVIGLIANSLDDKPKHHPAPLPEPARHRRVPAVCAIEIEGSSGDRVAVYPEKCLRREGFTYQLPDCARNVRIYGKRDRIYPASCLRNAGFRVGR